MDQGKFTGSSHERMTQINYTIARMLLTTGGLVA